MVLKVKLKASFFLFSGKIKIRMYRLLYIRIQVTTKKKPEHKPRPFFHLQLFIEVIHQTNLHFVDHNSQH